MKTVKTRIFSGAVCEQLVFSVSERTVLDRSTEPRPRFKNDEEREKYNKEKSMRYFVRLVNTNFSPTSLYCTLTLDPEHEIHDFPTAKRELDNFIRRLRRKYPDARIVAVMGRGKSTHRIHFHMITEGVPKEFIKKKWDGGEISRIDHLREHVKYDGVDHGQDYTGLAVYLFGHWTPEQGKKRWTATQNLLKPEREKPTPVLRHYSEAKPPRAPKGFVFVESKATQYGFLYYKYVREIPKPKRGRPRKGDVTNDE